MIVTVVVAVALEGTYHTGSCSMDSYTFEGIIAFRNHKIIDFVSKEMTAYGEDTSKEGT